MKKKNLWWLLAFFLVPTLTRSQTVPIMLPMLGGGATEDAVRYVGVRIHEGEDIGQEINEAYASLPPSGGTIVVVADPNGGCYKFLTPIVAAVPGKYLSLEGGNLNSQIVTPGSPACLNYVPTTASSAITLDYVIPRQSASWLVHGIRNLTLTNGQCQTIGGCGSDATGITFGGVNGGAQEATFEGLRVVGFGTALSVLSSRSSSGNLFFHHCAVSYNTTGFADVHGDAEHVSLDACHFQGNGTGVSSSASVTISNSTLDANTTLAVNCLSPAACDLNDDHFENGTASTTHFLAGNGVFSVLGGDMRDDGTSGTTDWWMSFAGASFLVLGTSLTSGGRTATEVILNENSGTSIIQNNSSNILTNMYSNPQLLLLTPPGGAPPSANGAMTSDQAASQSGQPASGSATVSSSTATVATPPNDLSSDNSFTGNNTFSEFNNCVWVDASKFPRTDVGVSQAIAAANTQTKCLRLSPSNGTSAYVFKHSVQWASADDIVLDLTGAVINMEASGAAFILGESGVRHAHVKVFGGWIRKTSGGVYKPDVTAGNVGIEFRNISGGIWQYAIAWGFEKAVYLHAVGTNQGVSEIYVQPLQFMDDKFGVYMQPDRGGGNFVNGNHVLPGIITYASSGVNFAGGYNIYIDDNGNLNGADGNVVDGTTLESSLPEGAGGNRPEAPIWVNGRQNIFIKPYTEFLSFKPGITWVVDNSGTDSQRNQFLGSRGGNPILGLSSFRIQTAGSSNAFQTVTSERGIYIAGGNNGTRDPMVVLQEMNTDANTALSIRDTTGTQRVSILSNGSTAVSQIAIGGGTALITSNQSGTGSLCMTTSCAMTTPALNNAIINGSATGSAMQGSDPKLLTSGTLSGTGSPLCLDANGGATTTGCGASLVQATRLGPSCKTGNNSFWSCTNILMWPNPFPDANYVVTCSGIGPSNPRANVTVASRSPSSVIVNVVTYGAMGVSFSEIDCTGVHNAASANTASVTSAPANPQPPQTQPPQTPVRPSLSIVSRGPIRQE